MLGMLFISSANLYFTLKGVLLVSKKENAENLFGHVLLSWWAIQSLERFRRTPMAKRKQEAPAYRRLKPILKKMHLWMNIIMNKKKFVRLDDFLLLKKSPVLM